VDVKGSNRGARLVGAALPALRIAGEPARSLSDNGGFA
jgi:hypothetical protein